mgnify:CR=1 FL=1
MQKVLSKMGKNYTDKELTRMIRSVDEDGNGKISIDEFIKLLE